MKIKYFLILIALTVFSACKKDKFNNTDTKVGISRVTFFPVFEITGNSIISIVKGSGFTDPGVKAKEGTSDLAVTVSGSVDPNTVGLYILNYSATNKDGFVATAQRTVVVIPAAELPSVDLSGEYETTGGTPNATITKVAPAVYFTTNCWGNGSAAIIPAYFICTDGATLILPLQTGPAGRIQTTHPGTYAGGLISWEIIRLDFAPPLTRAKTWQKI